MGDNNSIRLPMVPLSYEMKSLVMPGEIYTDYTSKKLFMKSKVTGEEIDFAKEISMNLIELDANKIVGVVSVGRGGTGRTEYPINSMIYADTTNTLNTVNTTEFGRTLLSAQNGTVVPGLVVDTISGRMVDDAAEDINSLWTAWKIKHYVDTLLGNSDAMVLKGILGTDVNKGMILALPTVDYSAGWTYRVGTSGTYAGQICEVGDLIFCIKDYDPTNIESEVWWVQQGNSDGSIIALPPTGNPKNHIAIYSDSSGKILTASGTTIPDGYLVGSNASTGSRHKIAIFGDTPGEIFDSELEIDLINNKIIGLDVNIGSETTPGIVASSADKNKISIDPVTGIMEVNKIGLDKLDLNGGGTTGGSFGISAGGTGLTTLPVESMLWYDTTGDIMSTLNTTVFGRGLLSMTAGVKKTGLNADQVDGFHAYEMQTLTKVGIPEEYFITPIYDDTLSKYKFKVNGIAVETAVDYADKAGTLTGILPLNLGGTGANTAGGAITNLGITASAAELNYVKGVTSAIQSQLNGKAATDHGTHVTFPSTGVPASPTTTGSLGIAVTVSRSDHSHPVQSDITGNAATADKLKTARSIYGNNFDGGSNVAGTPTVTGVKIAAASPTINFHFNNAASSTSNLTETAAGVLNYSGDFRATRVYSATFGDYAEWFLKKDENEKFEVGDIIMQSSPYGVTKSIGLSNSAVVGIYSENYGHILGGDALDDMEENRNRYIPIGLCGRLPVKVIGTAEIGDLIVSSDIKGVGVVNNNATIGAVIGKVLEDKTYVGVGLVQVLIKNA